MRRLDRRAFLFLSALSAPATTLRALVQPAAAASAGPSLDAFLRLSRRLLERPSLDAGVGATYLDALLAAPGNATLLAGLAKAVDAGTERTPEQRALEATVVEWWYTGVYARNGERRLATHAGALMWSALGMPAPGSCAGTFGAWSEAPSRKA